MKSVKTEKDCSEPRSTIAKPRPETGVFHATIFPGKVAMTSVGSPYETGKRKPASAVSKDPVTSTRGFY